MAFTGLYDLLIPIGKRVKITGGGTDLQSRTFVLDGELTLSISSNYSPLLSSNATANLSALSGVLQGFGVNVGSTFKFFGFEVWTGSQPISATCSIIINMKNDAFNDVVKPTFELCQLVLPAENSVGMLIPPGPSVLDALTGAGGAVGNIANQVVQGISETTGGQIAYRSRNRASIKVGNFSFNNVLITKADPTFSPEVDENGNPIKATIELSFQSLFYGSKEQLYSILPNGGQGQVE